MFSLPDMVVHTTADLNASSVFPPDSLCFVRWRAAQNAFGQSETIWDSHGCAVTPGMVDFLNLTHSAKAYVGAYCNNPPDDDACPFGYCPQPDIAGPLVRIATYISTICLSIMIFYSPDEVQDAFWAQILTVYSLLITTGISIAEHSLTKFHAVISLIMVGSPLTFYLSIYALLSLRSVPHRLSGTVGKGHRMQRLLVLGALVLWIALAVYVYLLSDPARFSQSNCGDDNTVVRAFLLAVFLIFFFLLDTKGSRHYAVLPSIPIILTVVAWGVAIWMQRRRIWPVGEKYRFRFWTVWKVIGEEYPFLHFVSVVVIPFVYWTATVELGVAIGATDNYFSLSFGQVLAVFVAVPPMISVGKLLPRFAHWVGRRARSWYLWCRGRGGLERSFREKDRESLIITPYEFDPHAKDDEDEKPEDEEKLLSGETVGANKKAGVI